MNFDPMTGEPIEEVKEPEMNFDPMTGEPIEEAKEPEMNFDPMTGEPIQKAEEPEMNFDPMTGQPISQAGAQDMNFDPMTGQPIYNGQKPKNKKLKPVLLGVAGVVVVGVVVFAGITSGAFLGKGNKVLLATANTLKEENHLAKDLSGAANAMLSGKYTMSVKGEAEGVGVDVTYLQDDADKQVKGIVDAGYVDVEFDAVLNKKEIMAKIPMVSNQVFTYNYTEEKDGYLVDTIGEDNIAAVDQLLQAAYSSNEQEKVVKDLTDAVIQEYKELEFEKVDKKEYEVNGKDRNCKGYEVTITSDNVLNILDNVEEVLEDYYEDSLEKIDFNSAMSEIRKDLREMPDMDIAFYIYKNKLACINVEVAGSEAELQFLGGDTRMQNMVLEVEGLEVLEVKGDTDGGEERTRIYVSGTEYCDMKYNYKDGDLEIEAPGMFAGAKIDAGRNGVVVSLDEFTADGKSMGLEGEISIQKGAKIEKIKGETFDIGNASKSEIEDLAEEIAGAGLGGLIL